MVAVAPEDAPVAVARWRSAGRHAENLFSYIDAAMAEAGVSRTDLSLIAASVGPGGFTSLRVGLATAKGLALGLGLPIVGVSSLNVLARSIEGNSALVRVAVMNAYRGEVFAAAYRIVEEEVEVVSDPSFGPPAEVLASIRDAVGEAAVGFRGEGVEAHRETIETIFRLTLGEGGTAMATPQALIEEVRYVTRTRGYAELARLEPTYLRPSDARFPHQPPQTQHSD